MFNLVLNEKFPCIGLHEKWWIRTAMALDRLTKIVFYHIAKTMSACEFAIEAYLTLQQPTDFAL